MLSRDFALLRQDFLDRFAVVEFDALGSCSEGHSNYTMGWFKWRLRHWQATPGLSAHHFCEREACLGGVRKAYPFHTGRPTRHCAYKRATENTIAGERSAGDARLNYDELTYGWFDHFLKVEDASKTVARMPKVRYFTMGSNKWQSFDTWPPATARPVTYYWASAGRANSLNGDGALLAASPAADHPDRFPYNPTNPVPSYGGNVYCTGNAVTAGAFDQRKMEARAAERADGLTDSGGVFRSDRNGLAAELDGFPLHYGLHRAVGLGRDPDDFGEAEIGGSELLEPANNLVGVRAAGAGMLLAELLPGEVQGFVKTVFADAGQALGLGRRAVGGGSIIHVVS